MNWTSFLIGALAGGLLFSVILLLILVPRINQREVHIGKNKVKGGPGNTQDLDIEVDEAEQLNKRQQRKKDKELQAEAEKKMNEVTNLLNNKL